MKHTREAAVMEYVGVCVSSLRESAGLSIRDLADKTGIHRNTVAKIEDGEQNVTISTVAVLARELGVPPADLMPNYYMTANGRRRGKRR